VKFEFRVAVWPAGSLYRDVSQKRDLHARGLEQPQTRGLKKNSLNHRGTEVTENCPKLFSVTSVPLWLMQFSHLELP
jgi:hypothetical protein